jgi:hypothetical protein
VPSQIRQTAFRLPEDLLQQMEALRARDGMSLAEQVRRGVRLLLDERLGPPPMEASKKRAAKKR